VNYTVSILALGEVPRRGAPTCALFHGVRPTDNLTKPAPTDDQVALFLRLKVGGLC
jgi:hypothetical protein